MASKKIKHKNIIKETKTTVFIVDDHPIVRDGLTTIINHHKEFVVCGYAEDSHETLKAIAEIKPNVVIVDISLKNSDGIELTRNIKLRYPKLPVIVLSFHDESIYAERALRAGARAYLMKEVASDNIIKAICTVLADEIYVSDKISKKLLHKIAGNNIGAANTSIDNLSDREFEIFSLIGEGYKASQIARRLHLSAKTIETYRARIKEKLNLTSAAELLQYSIKWAKGENKR
jgi:DNA-binding NarL/FixJ family response regulator